MSDDFDASLNLSQFSEEEQRELIQIFLEDGDDQLNMASAAIVQLEKAGPAKDVVDGLYRVFHSLKGTAGTYGFPVLTDTTHQLENILDAVVKNTQLCTEDFLDLVMAAIDFLRQAFDAIASGQDYKPFMVQLSREITRYQQSASPTDIPSAPAVAAESPAAPSTEAPEGGEITSLREESIRIRLDKVNKLVDLSGEMAVRKNYGELTIPKMQEILNLIGQADAKLILHEADSRKTPKSRNTASPLAAHRQSLMRIRDATDELLDSFGQWFFQLNVLVEEIKYEILRTRMVPISLLFNQIRQQIRKLLKDTGKQIQIELHGEDLDMDKRVMDEIQDPIMHLIRNAVDHGIEPEAQRRASGKTPHGTVVISAAQNGSEITLEVFDDGAGIDWERVQEKAVKRGFVTRDEFQKMGPDELTGLLLRPGFSTRDTADTISGRGVGLDVVASNVRHINGELKITSARGIGTTVHITIPTNLAITRALIFEVGNQLFAVPAMKIRRVDAIPAPSGNGLWTVEHEGQTVQILAWRTLLGMASGGEGPSRFQQIMILANEDAPYGLAVDRFLDVQDIVMRPLLLGLPEAAMFSGVTFLPDGNLAFILSVVGVGEKVHAWCAQHPEILPQPLGILAPVAPEETAVGEEDMIICRTGSQRVAVRQCDVCRVLRLRAAPSQKLRKRYVTSLGRRYRVVDLCRIFQTTKENATGHSLFLHLQHEAQGMIIEVDEIVQHRRAPMEWVHATYPLKRWCQFQIPATDGDAIPVLDVSATVARVAPRLPDAVQDMDAVGTIFDGGETASANTAQGKSAGGAILSFQVHGESYGVPFKDVIHVSSDTDFYRFNGIPENPEGYMNLRGDCVTVFDLPAMMPPRTVDNPAVGSGVMIFLERQDMKTALRVDSVGDVYAAGECRTRPADISCDNVHFPPLYVLDPTGEVRGRKNATNADIHVRNGGVHRADCPG